MLNSEAIDLMMSRLGDRRAPKLRGLLLLELNNKILELNQGPVIPWFLQDVYTGTTVVDQNYILLPSDFSREVEDGGKFKLRTSESPQVWKKAVKVRFDQLEEETENFDAAFPEGYALFGEKLYLGPTPKLAYSFKLPYYKKTAVLADNGSAVTNPWLLHFFNYVTLSALSIVARLHVQSMELSGKIDPELRVSSDLFWRAVEARENANMDPLLDNSEN